MTKRSHVRGSSLAISRKWQMLLAIALLLAAVGLVITLNRPATTVEYLVATRDLPTGVTLDSSAFKAVPLSLGVAGSAYLRQIPADTTLKTPIRAGELLAISSLGAAQGRFSVVLTPNQSLSPRIRVGSLVDVWFVAKANSLDAVAEPIRVATGLEVRSIEAIDAAISSGLGSGAAKVELAANETDLPALILASSNSGFISVISAD